MNTSFLTLMTDIMGSGGVLTGDDVAARSCDPLKMVAADAMAILRPRSTHEVSQILRAVAGLGLKVVVHGGRTGVSGGAYTNADEVVISLERMKEIEAIDPINRTIVVQAGVTIQALQEAAEAEGMYYPVDLGARGTATVGGTLATNAGGNRTLRWGMTRDRVLGLEAVLPNGDIVSSMHKLVKNNSGYDLKHFFIGAEGTLGIVTKAVMRLVPAMSSHEVALIGIRDYDSVLTILNEAQKLSSLSAFELMYNDYYGAVVAAMPQNCPIPPTFPYYVLIETMGYHRDLEREVFEKFLIRIYETTAADEIILAESDTQRKSLWAVRESVEAAVKSIAPCLTYDVSLEVSDIDDYVEGLRSALRRFPEARMIVNGHIGDNNIHLGITIGPETMARETEINSIVYNPLTMFHGSMSAEHGIGTTKTEYLHISRSEEEIALMRRIKRAIDPSGLLNGRVIFSPEGSSL